MNHHGKRNLIVDDEPNDFVPIQFLMGQQGSGVMIAERGEDALDLIYHCKPNLVKLDIILPEIDGCPVFANILHSASIFNFTSFPSTHQYIASSPITRYHIVAEKYIAYCYTK